MKSKKLLSLMLALVMALSLAIPAFAGDGTVGLGDAASTEITGSTKAPTVKLKIPGNNQVVVNPYKMTATIGDDESNDQIFSKLLYVENLSDVSVKVSVAAAGEVAGDAKLANAPLEEDDTNKSIYMYLSGKVVDKNDGTAITWPGSDKTIDDETGAVQDNDDVHRTVVSARGTAVEMGELAQGIPPVSGSGNNTPALKGGYLALQLGGDANANPSKAWTDGDKVTKVTLTYTFAAGEYTPPSDEGATLSFAAPAAGSDPNWTLALKDPNSDAGGDPTFGNVKVTFAAGNQAGPDKNEASTLTAVAYKWVSKNTDVVTVSNDTTDTATITAVADAAGGAGADNSVTADVVVTVTLSNGAKVSATITVTVAAST